MDEQDAEYTRKPVTCERCGRIWWVSYGDALRAIRMGKMSTKSRQVRVGEALFDTGSFETEHYLAGICEVCDFGLTKPGPEIEWRIMQDRKAHLLHVGVDPELAFDYARAEYEQDYQATFNPAFAEFWATIGWSQAEHSFPDVNDLPDWLIGGQERGLEDGSAFCPHVTGHQRGLPWMKV